MSSSSSAVPSEHRVRHTAEVTIKNQLVKITWIRRWKETRALADTERAMGEGPPGFRLLDPNRTTITEDKHETLHAVGIIFKAEMRTDAASRGGSSRSSQAASLIPCSEDLRQKPGLVIST